MGVTNYLLSGMILQVASVLELGKKVTTFQVDDYPIGSMYGIFKYLHLVDLYGQ